MRLNMRHGISEKLRHPNRYNREHPFETAMGSYEAARKTSKKVINFFVVGLTYGCLISWIRIFFTPVFLQPLIISCERYDFVTGNSLSSASSIYLDWI